MEMSLTDLHGWLFGDFILCQCGQPELVISKLPWIAMKTVDGGLVPWLASQTDILAEDYVEVTDY